MRAHGVKVDDSLMDVGGQQVMHLTDGFQVPFDRLGACCTLPIQRATFEEMEQLPVYTLTSIGEYNAYADAFPGKVRRMIWVSGFSLFQYYWKAGVTYGFRLVADRPPR